MDTTAEISEAIDTGSDSFRHARKARAWAVVPLRDAPAFDSIPLVDGPDQAANYWRTTIATDSRFNAEVETFVVLVMNTRRRVKGHFVVSQGTMDTLLVHPREVFRGAIVAGAAAVILMHNHPSGDPQPSEGDIRVTRELIRGGQLLKIEVLDHVVVGNPGRSSLRELGYFYS